jgi:WhiB family transcriptional regulator, redox-sensing transcriptional regulator
MQCLSHALDERIEFGVWGGMTERERRAMLRGRPDVTCWESFLAEVAARRAGAAQPAPASVPVAPPVPVTVPAAREPVALPTPLVPAARSAQATRPQRLSEAA